MLKNIATAVHVFYLSNQDKISVGRLAIKDRNIFFEYDSEFIKTGLELSPFKLPLKAGVISSEDRVFDGLFGIFNDSLPDGWGRLLLDRKLLKLGINPGSISPLDRLCYVGSHGMGALCYEPETNGIITPNTKDLDEIADEMFQFQEHDNDNFVDDLLAMNGSSAGARPKIIVTVDNEYWIVKFRSFIDPKDIGLIEYAYHLMAKAALLDVPDAKIFPSKKGHGYFGVKRFDRIENKRIHMHTISGLLHADHRIPSLDYKTIMQATFLLTKNYHEAEKQFRAAVFNVLSHNRDDHSKNFSFLMDEKGAWHVSKAYDLTFSSGPNGEHCTTIIGEGKNPKLVHLLELAKTSNIKKQNALDIIQEVRSAILKWNIFATDVGVSNTSFNMIKKNLDAVAKTVFF